jgi:hypothetical protein
LSASSNSSIELQMVRPEGFCIQCLASPKPVRVIPWICTSGMRYRVAQSCASPQRFRVLLMEYARLETATLAHVDDSYYYGAYCRKCKHSARLSLTKLRAHLGDTCPLVKIKDKLRCERCNSRQIVVTFLAPDQRTGNLVPLFGEKPS